MAVFEISSKKQKDGKRRFTAVLYKLQPPDCVVNNVGTDGHWNDNGISFIEEYAKNNLDSIKDMSLTCDFIDDENTEISGHGETNEFTEDDLPIYETKIVGHFTKGYIGDYEEDGIKQRVVFGDGIIDEMRYPNFVKKLEENVAQGIYPSGSIEIIRPSGSKSIEYLNEKFETGRIPTKYIHGGFALVLNPSDKTSKLFELNTNKKTNSKNGREEKNMDKETLAQILESVKNTIVETNSKNSEFETQISALNNTIEEKDSKIVELNATVEQLQKALDDLKKEHETYWAEREMLEQELAQAKVEKRINELNSAIADFSDEEKSYAQAEIDAFNADPMACEVNSIVDKIYVEMGKKAKEADNNQKASEINSKNESVDIYGEVDFADSNEEVSIY